jgi:hypothetical protein
MNPPGTDMSASKVTRMIRMMPMVAAADRPVTGVNGTIRPAFEILLVIMDPFVIGSGGRELPIRARVPVGRVTMDGKALPRRRCASGARLD